MHWFILICAVAGCAISLVLWAMHAPALTSFSERLCSPSAAVNCQDVLASRWAKVRGVPVAAVGAVYFAFVAAWFAVIGAPNHAGRRWAWLPRGVTLAGLGASVWFVFLLTTRLPVWCTWCMAAHAANLLLFIAVWCVRPVAEADTPPYPSVRRVAVLGGVAFVLVGFAGLTGLAAFHQAVSRLYRGKWLEAVNNADYIVWRLSAAPVQDIPVRGDEPMHGAADAAHTVVVFSDFQCPHCRMLDDALSQLAAVFPGRMRVVFRHYPLCADCNPRVTRDDPAQHRFACDAAQAAEAVRRLRGPAAAVAYHRKLFAAAESFAERPYARLLADAAIESVKLDAEMRSEATTSRIREDIELATRLGVNGSGVAFLDGRRLEQWQIMDARDPNRIDGPATRKLWERLLGGER